MKIKKKIVILILILSIFSAAITPPKKTEASSIALGYAAFKVGVSFTAFATYATWFYANGYHMPVSELITSFTNKYYDYSLGVYNEKPTKMNVLEKLNLYTSAVLSGNVANIPNAFDLKAIQDDLVNEFPQKINIDIINPDIVKIPAGSIYSLYDNLNGYKVFKSSYKDKIMKFQYDASWPDYFMYIRFSPVDYVYTNYAYYPVVQLISPLGRVVNYLMPDNISFDINKVKQYFYLTGSFGSSSVFSNDSSIFYPSNVVLDNDPLRLYSTAENTFSQGSSDWANPFPVYYPALNNKAATTDELLGLMNVDEYLQREIARMIEEQDRTKERPLILPTIEAGKVVYPGTQSGTDEGDTPSTGIDVPDGWWDRVLDIPRDITTGLTTWWDNTLMPGLDTIKEKITEIPTSITNITDLTQEIEMDQIDFTRLKLDGIITKFPFSIPFDYVKLLKNFKRDPIAPDLKIKLNTHYFNIDHDIGTASINKYIVFFRWFALTIFVYALMMITRKVIKW